MSMYIGSVIKGIPLKRQSILLSPILNVRNAGEWQICLPNFPIWLSNGILKGTGILIFIRCLFFLMRTYGGNVRNVGIVGRLQSETGKVQKDFARVVIMGE